MPCYHPIEVGIRRKSLYNTRKILDQQVVPCGTCIGCRSEQGRQWMVRMMHEQRMHEESAFVTLTYSDEEIPNNGSLCAEDFSGFIKRLRKTQEGRISFYGCGEYGERTQRAHYHAVLFGLCLNDRVNGVASRTSDTWKSKTLDDAWGLGITEGGSVTMASASYVAGYVRKKVKGSDFVRCNPLTGEMLLPEFARMSLRPAIGKTWLELYWRDVYPRDYVVIEGKEAKPPRYYDKWMDQNEPLLMEDVRQRRYDEAIEMSKYTRESAEAIATARAAIYEARAGI